MQRLAEVAPQPLDGLGDAVRGAAQSRNVWIHRSRFAHLSFSLSVVQDRTTMLENHSTGLRSGARRMVPRRGTTAPSDTGNLDFSSSESGASGLEVQLIAMSQRELHDACDGRGGIALAAPTDGRRR